MKVGLTGKTRALRRRETEEETILWRHLRNRQIDGWKFRRQVPRGRYVVDFLCVEAGLAIEVDGSQHRIFGAMRDEVRTRALEQDGVRVLRFGNEDILGNLDGVLDEIHSALGGKEAPSLGTLRLGATRRPLPRGRGEAEAAELHGAIAAPSDNGSAAGRTVDLGSAPQNNAAEDKGAT